jgi:periplasmic protein CpxP/Spy
MKRIHGVLASVIAGAALAVAAVTYAQPLAGMGPGYGRGFGPGMGMGPGFGMGMGPGFGPGMGMGPWHGPMAGVDPAVVDSRLGDFKAQLKITPTQEAAWQAFAGAAKDQAASMHALHAKMLDAAGSAPERMNQRTELMRQHSMAMTKMTDAFNALYAALTPEQKAIADQHGGPIAHRGMPFARRTS